MRRVSAGVLIALGAALGTSGCSGETVSGACADWVLFETPQDLFDHAPLVLVGRPIAEDGQQRIYGYDAQIHVVSIEKILKGDIEQDEIRIASMPQTCTDVSVVYPRGDPLDIDQRVIIFASEQEGQWFTITPEQGVLSFAEGEELPFSVGP
ncbi:hypothetical protein BJ994_003032 [Arthrobacter pigmenti]|uniref:Lipoprotein n=1 Tax=Arthrobacter pigmenti TaxID=271432 RepID=A0A846RYA5_9MICC|nr:hypothetical protein [Arthrobacter pigmenti]NJC23956.1 hypothetical protein [Arthrobacter pigmenti]